MYVPCVSPVCVCLQFPIIRNSATSYQTYSSVDLVLSELCSLRNMRTLTKFHQIMNLSCDFPHGWSHTVFRAAEVC